MANFKIRLITFFAAKDREALYSQQKQDWELTVAHELLIAKFRLKLKKVGKTTRPFIYDLNQIPYGYTVEGRSSIQSTKEDQKLTMAQIMNCLLLNSGLN